MIKTYASTEHSENGIKFIELKGSLDIFNSDDVILYITTILEDTKENIVVFDLANLEFITAFGISSLIKIIETFQKNFYLLNTNKMIMEMFNLLGFQKSCIFISDIKEIDNAQPLFPKTIECPMCKQKLNVSKVGRIKCTSCKAILSINKEGKIK